MHATDRLPAAAFAEIRRRTMFDFCKWDPQTEDVSVLAPYALVLDDDEWQFISTAATALDAELIAAERELVARPRLIRKLGLPRAITRWFDGRRPPAISGPRVNRFDFHWTTDGWRISEVNCDVPGGFIEGGGFTTLVAGAFSELQTTGDPADRYIAAIADFLLLPSFLEEGQGEVLREANCDAEEPSLTPPENRGRTVALVHATAYVDDRQVMIYLARKLESRGLRCQLTSPAHIVWRDGRASVRDGQELVAVDLIVRFFPAEWLPSLPRRLHWQHFFVDSQTPQSNPGVALLSQSKRLPLVWDELTTTLPRWRALLPETRDPRHVPWRKDDGWVLKTALGRVGDGVGLRGVTAAKDWNSIARAARWWPGEFVAQRRFAAIAVATPDGPRYPALGVFTVDGQASGIYARVARQPLVDHAAQDIAVLLPVRTAASSSFRKERHDGLRATV